MEYFVILVNFQKYLSWDYNSLYKSTQFILGFLIYD